MRTNYLLLIFLFAASLVFYNCSEVEDEITQAPTLQGVHIEGFATVGSNDFHGKYLKENKWDLETCQKCHASNYSGGPSKVSCLTCHPTASGPEACNTCHGVFSNPLRAAPPRDLSGNFETTARGVGAHTSHLYETKISNGVSCFECHPSKLNSTDGFVKAHIDEFPAEIEFGHFASSGSSKPIYNADLTCSNTYCHGNFEFSKAESANQWAYSDSVIVGANFNPIWNKVDGTQAACGTCHGKDGTPTPTGHFGSFTAEQCINCHASAFNEDGTLNKFAHLNGEKNLN